MKRKRDPLVRSPHWHIDCRLEAELPEDNVIGTRFLINVLFGAAAFGMLLFTGWLAYLSFNLRYQIHDWEQRIKENRAEMLDVQRMQRDYAAGAAKIDQAYALVRPHFYVTGLIADLGRTRPESVVLDYVDWTEAGVIVRGSLKENAERASRLLGGYVELLRHDEKIGPLFREIVLTDLDRGATGEALRFEISLRLKPLKP